MIKIKNAKTMVMHTKIIGSILLTSLLLSACGGGENSSPINNNSGQPTNPVTNLPENPPSVNPSNPETPIVNEPSPENPIVQLPVVSEKITTMVMSNKSNISQSDIPVTFGQVFSLGVLKSNESLIGKLSNGITVPLQVNVKTTYADGSVKHAIISAIIPQESSGQSLSMDLVKTNLIKSNEDININDLLKSGFSANVKVNISGTEYSAVAEDLLKNNDIKSWLSGSLASEWIVSTPLKTASGMEHPNLSARFAIRAYKGLKNIKVDVVLENTWAYVAPQNFVYDVIVNVGGKPVYSKNALTHYVYARWRKTFWSDNEPQIHIEHDPRYLIDTKAVPNYDPNVKIAASELNGIKSRFSGGSTEPMSSGLATPYMPTTGGRPDIGLMPGWAVSYLLSQDQDAKNATLGTADLAGSWSAHFRDRNTDKPIDLYDYPYMTILGRYGDTYNPKTKKYEAFPACAADCDNPNVTDGAHTPAFAYLPYLVTGDYYYLEELEFWAMYHAFATNPGYRENIKGLINSEQVRGQAWNLRTIGEAAYIIPDNDPLKPHLNTIIDNNLDWYLNNYVNNSEYQNSLGALLHGYALAYSNSTGLAPWQDDFFTSAIGHLNELGFTKAKKVLDWKAKFPVSRMTDPGYCWISGAIYSLIVKDNATNKFITNWSEIYKKNLSPEIVASQCGSAEMAKLLQKDDPGIVAGQMTGYASYNAGYPANMQPALAYSVDSGIANANTAWTVFSNRKTQPTYTDGAQFAIVPRK